MGIHPTFPPAERRPVPLDDARRSMWAWAEPIVIDRAVEIYSPATTATVTIAMARKHCRLWRAVLLDQPGDVAAAMEDLRCCAGDHDLAALIDGINDLILEELVDIVMSRYRSSRSAIKTFSLVLMSATSRLGPERIAA